MDLSQPVAPGDITIKGRVPAAMGCSDHPAPATRKQGSIKIELHADVALDIPASEAQPNQTKGIKPSAESGEPCTQFATNE